MHSTFMITPRWIFLRMVNVSDRSCGENQNTWYSVNFLRKFCRLWDDVKKIRYSQTGHRWQCGPENVRIAWGTTKAGIQALWIFNIHCCFTAVVVKRMRLIGTLYEHSLSCLCLHTPPDLKGCPRYFSMFTAVTFLQSIFPVWKDFKLQMFGYQRLWKFLGPGEAVLRIWRNEDRAM